VLLILAANFSPVTDTNSHIFPRTLLCDDTGGKFAANVNGNAGKFATVANYCTLAVTLPAV
jgi:hypothetical protein